MKTTCQHPTDLTQWTIESFLSPMSFNLCCCQCPASLDHKITRSPDHPIFQVLVANVLPHKITRSQDHKTIQSFWLPMSASKDHDNTRSPDHSICLVANVLPHKITRSQDHKVTRSQDHSIYLLANLRPPVEWCCTLQSEAASAADTGSSSAAVAQRGHRQSLKEASQPLRGLQVVLFVNITTQQHHKITRS
jgi:hypothetical protein